jgi:hypothetical protein
MCKYIFQYSPCNLDMYQSIFSCQVLATDLNGKKVFLTRYIRDQNLPPDFGFDPTNPPPNAMVSLLR